MIIDYLAYLRMSEILFYFILSLQHSFPPLFCKAIQKKKTSLPKLLGKLFHNKTAKINALHVIIYTIIYKAE